MAIASSGAFIDVLRCHKLLPADQLRQLPHLAHGRCGEGRAFAKLLVQRGWLTVYQINEILAGRAHELIVGPYHVLERLGRGGLSQVFKARHADYHWQVALKVLKADVLSHQEGRRQFLQEMEAMGQLDHPNIVQFCDVDQSEGTFYFAMEFVEGSDLGKHVALTGPLPVAEACDYLRQVALGLQHAHEHNLVHRDIKPVNLFLTHAPAAGSARGGTGKKQLKSRPLIKILDWGLAALRYPRGMAAPVDEAIAKSVLVGTADYLAPEQARDAAGVDIRGDIYSLGCTLFFLLTGQPPFPSGTIMQKILQHQQAAPPELSQFRADVPEGLQAILRRLLAKKAEDRFQTPAAVAAALSAFVRAGAGFRGQESGIRNLGMATRILPRPNDQTPLPESLAGTSRILREQQDTMQAKPTRPV